MNTYNADSGGTKDKIIELINVSKSFGQNKEIEILQNVSLEIYEGEKVAIIGPSGSGKSTLLSLISGLDKVDKGEIIIDGKDISKMNDDQLSKFRNNEIGIIFQSFELISPFTAMENVMAPLDIAGKNNYKHNIERVNQMLKRVDLVHRSQAYPYTLSGGEKQRIAIARSLVNSPKIILADEPTGSLDGNTGTRILDLLLEQAGEEQNTLIIITHDMNIANKMNKVYELSDKRLKQIK